MTSVSARALRGSAAAVLVLVVAGCGSSSATSSAAPATSSGGSAPPATSASTPPATTPTTPEVTITPSEVGGSTELTSWLKQVCTAGAQMRSATKSTFDPGEIAKDPQKAAQDTVDRYRKLADEFHAYADTLSQIGAPDVPNGQLITSHLVADLNSLGDLWTQVTDQIPDNPTMSDITSTLLPAMQSAKMKATFKDLQKIGDMVDTKQIEAAAKNIPECKDSDFD